MTSEAAAAATTTATTAFVDTFVDHPKHHDETEIMNKLAAFSDDDDTCSFDSDQDEKLLTPPVAGEAEDECQNEDDEAIDWEFWSTVISDFPQFNQPQLQQLSIQVQHGIPSALRGTIWPVIAKKTDNGLQDDYIQLLKQDSVYAKAITRDLHRTFPQHPFFQSHVGQEALFNVVKAYSIYDPEVGYCQGIAFIAGPLLLHMPEEEAFCILVQLMQKYHLRGHYTPQLDLLRQRLFQFDGLLLDHLPHIHRHFNEQGVRSNMYASQWFLTLFAYKFPLDVVYRIYDTLFTEGVDCLFRIGLALLFKNQCTILSLDFEALVTYLKDDMLTVYKDNITDLLCESFEIKISHKKLDKLAKDYQIETAKADTEAGLIQSLRKENRHLAEKSRSVEIDNENLKKEQALVAQALISKKLELARVHDENDALKQQAAELRRVIDIIPTRIENQVQADMEALCLKNQTLNQRNAQLQDQLQDMEALVIEIKLKYAQSESERELLNQRVTDLKKWMNSVINKK